MVYIPLLFADDDIWKALQLQHSNINPGEIKDIHQGEKYREVGSFLSQPGNLTLLMNTDGVQIFKSSSVSLWPIWVVINELPPSLRYICCIYMCIYFVY